MTATTTPIKGTSSKNARKSLTPREKRMRKARKKILSSTEESAKFLREIGLLDNKNQLSKVYYP